MTKSKVAILRTRPQTVLDDYERLMRLAGFEAALPKGPETLLKINISWQRWYPACSTTPWQLEGVIRALDRAGYRPLTGANNATVVVDAHEGEVNNGHKGVLERYGVGNVHLYEPPVQWIEYKPKTPYMVLDKIFPHGVYIPDYLIGKNIVHLPTVKTHVFTTITGAMKNAFGGLLNYNRHWTHSLIHETLTDLLMIQKEIHPGIFAVMDGTLAGSGPGPRAMQWHEKNVILASADQVAIDAVSARIQGFDPLSLKFIRIGHERGLGIGDPRQIEIVGDSDAAQENWHFTVGDTFASWGQKLIYWGPLHPFEWLLLRTPIVPWSFWASNTYFNTYWYQVHGQKRVEAALKTGWGKLFQEYVHQR